ncbi:hypothetical protein [Rhizobium leguminosarum]|uniref:hypothetical protein n=1 Tax=Rhizobium leguminosarum TaxID=384 RepID=UPI000B927A94|nr:hypothetical protein [Rhizobium leguminosarum]ASS56439.1 hypothetical protein CHR56_18800 [Rhizobium leguminosarum bv. viciae]WSH63667.1 hypothetical protein U8Q05_18730 [Rhizobium ruizarguesonis]
MPTIIYRDDPNISLEDVSKIAAFADHVGKHCFDEFADDGSRRRSESLSGKVQAVSGALDFGADPHITPEAAKTIIALKDQAGGYCFDHFGERGHMGKTIGLLRMFQDVDDVLGKLVTRHLSPEEVEEAEAEWAHESQFYLNTEGGNPNIIRRDDMGSRAGA